MKFFSSSFFEKSLVNLAKAQHCQGVIFGRIHHPENKYYGDIHYLNSGDWVESISALVEAKYGNWNIIYYP